MKRLKVLLITVTIISGWILGSFVSSLFAGEEITGEQVYKNTCGKCHSERAPKERTDAEWKLLVTQMRVAAALTAEEARKVLQYLQDNN